MDRKNTLLLTVIAVATLLVAVVGATFAYFTAQTGAGAGADIRVVTSTSDSLEYGSFSQIDINANQQNFFKGAGSHQSTTTGNVTLKANAENEASYCYTADLIITTNGLSYTTTGETKPAELVLSISKGDAEATLTELGNTAIPGLTKITPIADHKVCTNPGANCTESTTVTLSGFDITEVGKDAGGTTLNIPGPETAGSKSVWKITAAAGLTVHDYWSATATLVNLDTDQQENTNKTFVAQLKFTSVDCTTGESSTATP